MSLRGFLTRMLIGFAISGACALAVPALASAADTLSITPCGSGCSPPSPSFTPNGNSSYKISVTVDQTEGAPNATTIQLQPGVLLDLNGPVAACITPGHSSGASASWTSACKIGTGTISTDAPFTANIDLYLVDPSSTSHVGGVDGVSHTTAVCQAFTGNPSATAPCELSHTELLLQQLSSGPAAGNIVGILATDLQGNTHVTGFTTSINGSVDGSPFTRMMTDCSPPIHSILTIVHGTTPAAVNASPDFSSAISGCAALPFTPQISGSATVTNKLASGAFAVSFTSAFSQVTGQASSHMSTISIPASVVSPNKAGLTLANTGTPVGNASTVSSLLPAAGGANTLTGPVVLTQASSTSPPVLNIEFTSNPALAFTLQGAIDPNTNSFVFTSLPDVPLISLTVSLKGGSKSLLLTTCKVKSGTLTGHFSAFSGKPHTSTSTLKVTGCPTPKVVGNPTVTKGHLGGLASGKPKLKFRVTKGKNAPKLKSFTLKLGKGLGLNKSAAKQGGVTVAGCGPFKAKVKSHKLVIKLVRTGSSCSVKLLAPALTESLKLLKKASKGKTLHFRFPLNVTDASGKTTDLKLKLTAK